MSPVIVNGGDAPEALAGELPASPGGFLSDPASGLRICGAPRDPEVPDPAVGREAPRILCPGARALAFGALRTADRPLAARGVAALGLGHLGVWLFATGLPMGGSRRAPGGGCRGGRPGSEVGGRPSCI